MRSRDRGRSGRAARDRSPAPRSVIRLPPTQESSSSGQPPSHASLAESVAETVTQNLKEQIAGLLKAKEAKDSEVVKEVEALKAAQLHASLLGEATEFQSESAQRQFIAFAKVKSGVSDALRYMASGDQSAAENSLKEIEKIADFRLDMIRRADSSPGGWATANVYERKVAGHNDKKNDKAWRSAVDEANQKRKEKKQTSGSGYGNRQPFQGNKLRSELKLYFV